MGVESQVNPANQNNSAYLGETTVSFDLKWRQKTNLLTLPAGDVVSSDSSVPPETLSVGHLPGASNSISGWNVGGQAEITKEVCYVGGQELYLSGAFNRYNWVTPIYRHWWSHDRWLVTYKDVEIDWSNLLVQLRAAHPVGNNQVILAAYFDDGTNTYDLNSYIPIKSLDTAYGSTSFGSFPNSSENLFSDSMQANGELTQQPLEGNPDSSTTPIYSDLNVEPLNSSSPTNRTESANGYCNKTTTIMPMRLTVIFGDLNSRSDGISEEPENSGIVNTDSLNNSNEPVNSSANKSALTPFTGGTTSDSAGSFSGVGYNPVQIFDGNSVLPYDSVYFTTGDYNSFVANGGGMVTESGIFPNSSTFYIDNIKLSIDGNTMSVIQLSDFDATAQLTMGEKIFGYIINASGDYQSSFVGYVYSKKRMLTGKGEAIAFECRCLKSYLSQFIAPAYVSYVAPDVEHLGNSLGIATIVKDALVRAGLGGQDISLPFVPSPTIEWTYENMSSVLDWAVRYLGNYVYYTDKSGVLNVKKFTSGSVVKSFRIPSRGESVSSSTKVLSFTPIEDNSRSRSKIIVVGDFPVKEIHGETVFNYPIFEINGTSAAGDITYYKPIDAYVKDPTTNKETGFWAYLNPDTNQWLYYFMFFPGKTLVQELPSNPDKSVEFIKVNDIYDVGSAGAPVSPWDNVAPNIMPLDGLGDWEMSPTFINTVPGNSFFYTEDKAAPGYADLPKNINNFSGGNKIVRPVKATVRYKYAIKENEPIKAQYITGYSGGVEVVKELNFKKIESPSSTIDDTTVMSSYLSKIREFYTPERGGTLVIDGLDLDLGILDKINITNTSLPTNESDDLVIHSIEYDVTNKKTTLELTNKKFYTQPYFDVDRQIQIARAATKNKLNKFEADLSKRVNRRI